MNLIIRLKQYFNNIQTISVGQQLNIKKSKKMGNSTYSTYNDPRFQIYVATSRQVHIAGGIVEGEVLLRVKKPISSQILIIELIGLEYVTWVRYIFLVVALLKLTYANAYCSYRSGFVLKRFVLTQPGDYVLPFSFILPSMITGTFYHSNTCFLKYMIRATLGKGVSQIPMNILEPARNPNEPKLVRIEQKLACCYCFIYQGRVLATLSCDRTEVSNGDTIKIKGCVDNTNGKLNIDGFRIVIERRRYMQSSKGVIKNQILQQYTIASINKQILFGDKYDFDFSAIIPSNLVAATAIGNIVANYYLLCLKTNYGCCCANNAEAKLHLIVVPKIAAVINTKISLPARFNGVFSPKVDFTDMKPYLFRSNNFMPYRNCVQPSLQLLKQLEQYKNNTTIQKNQNPQEKREKPPTKKNKYQNNGQKPVFMSVSEMINQAESKYRAQQKEKECAQEHMIPLEELEMSQRPVLPNMLTEDQNAIEEPMIPLQEKY